MDDCCQVQPIRIPKEQKAWEGPGYDQLRLAFNSTVI